MRTRKKGIKDKMRKLVLLGFVLAALWWVFSGLTIPLVLILGCGSIGVILLSIYRMEKFAYSHKKSQMNTLNLRYIPYGFWLLKEIILSNISVAKTILGFGDPLDPVVFDAFAHEETELGSVTYANSITLTPGTVTMAFVDGRITVHALTQESKKALLDGDMDERVHYAETGRPITDKVPGEK